MAGCENYEDATDDVFASFLRACPKLSWLFVDDNDAPVQVFGNASWNALGSGACPLLKVLWVDGTDVAKATVRKGLNSRKLKLCMINPDKNIGSSFQLDTHEYTAYFTVMPTNLLFYSPKIIGTAPCHKIDG